ncbi:cation:proton antiporter [Leptospira sp. GIMC2001]|uniref:cation:proton antiporter n=1 Tax=Leptospira sp. GIMC2001 TaxID=1513297 RepID=UPI00234B93E8|nr:cation:proton antiporter [Leptospira sp. GIMC2001]WCL49500.1 cation:proton antiporter [Leptospira sp. GIMC2001]
MSSRNILAYLVITIVSLCIASVVLWEGRTMLKESVQTETYQEQIIPDRNHSSSEKNIILESSEWSRVASQFKSNASSSLAKILFQIVIIMILARLVGILFRKLGQPTVIGEIIAGILLGPSFFGFFAPEIHSFFFSEDQMKILEILSQLGLILFMFVIGMEIDTSFIKKKAQSAILISHTSILFPFLLGMILAFMIFTDHAPANVSFIPFALFIGIAMSITAFPVLARILHEKGLTKTSLGTMAIACAAFDDLTAWSLLAMIVALIQSDSYIGVGVTIALTVMYGIAMVYLINPFLRRLSEIYVSKENLTKTAMAIVFVFLFFSALITEMIGIHALIGAFFAGVVMPSDQKLKDLISERIDYIALVFLLPLFFAYTGMRTNLWALGDNGLFQVLLLVLVFAIVGKFIGASLTSRYVGMNWKDSLSLGVLMNTRGLMELIVLNIGFQLGIITPALFSAFVVMTLVTTLAAGPGLNLINKIFTEKSEKSTPLEAFKKILISFAQPSMGVALIKLSDFLFGGSKDKTQISVVHITPTEILSPEEEKEYKKKSFADIEELTTSLSFNVEMVHRTTENVTYEILNQAKKANSRFLLIGAAKSLFTKNILGGRIRSILSYAPCNVGVLLDNGLDKIRKVLILKKNNSALGYEKFIHYLQREHNRKIKILPVTLFSTLKSEDFNDYHLVIVELELWKEREDFLEVEIQNLDASFLIIKFK